MACCSTRWVLRAIASILILVGCAAEDPVERQVGGTDSGAPTGTPPRTGASKPCLGSAEECGESGDDRPTAGPSPRCPSLEPTAGDACDLGVTEFCSYGSERTAACHRNWQCEDGRFVDVTLLGAEACREFAEQCPLEPAHGSDCVVGVGIGCEYDDYMTCFCSPVRAFGDVGSPGEWVCAGPPSDHRCPASVPNLGTGCDEAALQCVYAPNACFESRGSNVFCFDGAWQADAVGGCDG
jgi:hypothetical protein